MARGRMMNRSVSTSRRLASLPTDRARLLWSWALAHADRDGCVPGDPDVLRAVVVPMLGWTAAQTKDALTALVAADLVTMREHAGSRCAQFNRFQVGQQGMRYDREAPSKWSESVPAPDDDGPSPEDSGPTPDDDGPMEGKGREGKLKEDKAKLAPAADAVAVRDHYDRIRKKHRKRAVKWTATWKAQIVARLREGYSVDDLNRAASALFQSDHHTEGNFLAPMYAFRSADQVDRMLGSAQTANGRKAEHEHERKTRQDLPTLDELGVTGGPRSVPQKRTLGHSPRLRTIPARDVKAELAEAAAKREAQAAESKRRNEAFLNASPGERERILAGIP